MATLQLQSSLFSDSELHLRLRSFLAASGRDWLRRLELTVGSGRVALSGLVSSAAERSTLEAYCRRVAGVLDVDTQALSIAEPREPQSHDVGLTTPRNHRETHPSRIPSSRRPSALAARERRKGDVL